SSLTHTWIVFRSCPWNLSAETCPTAVLPSCQRLIAIPRSDCCDLCFTAYDAPMTRDSQSNSIAGEAANHRGGGEANTRRRCPIRPVKARTPGRTKLRRHRWASCERMTAHRRPRSATYERPPSARYERPPSAVSNGHDRQSTMDSGSQRKPQILSEGLSARLSRTAPGLRI